MPMRQTRRRLLTTLSLAGAAGFVRGPRVFAAEERLETTIVRLPRTAGVCIAPEYIVEPLLRAEGFTDIRYVDKPPAETSSVAHGKLDFDTNYACNFVTGIDAGEPIALLSGVHVGCFELFAGDNVRTIAELKVKPSGFRAWVQPPMCS
jgi:NitT/TauT family transport system substrate-binding protein